MAAQHPAAVASQLGQEVRQGQVVGRQQARLPGVLRRAQGCRGNDGVGGEVAAGAARHHLATAAPGGDLHRPGEHRQAGAVLQLAHREAGAQGAQQALFAFHQQGPVAARQVGGGGDQDFAVAQADAPLRLAVGDAHGAVRVEHQHRAVFQFQALLLAGGRLPAAVLPGRLPPQGHGGGRQQGGQGQLAQGGATAAAGRLRQHLATQLGRQFGKVLHDPLGPLPGGPVGRAAAAPLGDGLA